MGLRPATNLQLNHIFKAEEFVRLVGANLTTIVESNVVQYELLPSRQMRMRVATDPLARAILD